MTIDRNYLVDTDGTFADFTATGELKTSSATLDGAKDDLTGLIGTIEIEHHEIHEGEHFFIQNYIEVANAGVLNHTFLTGLKDVHMTFEVMGADAGLILQTYEGATGDSNGTTITPLNNKRNSETASTVTVRENPTNTAVVGATLLRATRAGTGGAVAQRNSGNISRGNEVILKKSTKYLIRITNLSTSANNISYTYSWYEE